MNLYIVYILIRQLVVFWKEDVILVHSLMDGHLQKLILRSYPKESEEFHSGGSFWLPWWRRGKQRSGRKEADWICQSKRHLNQIIQIKKRVYQEHIYSLKMLSNICARWSICTTYNPTLPPTVFCKRHCVLYVIFVFVGAYVWKRWHFQICFCP